MSNEKKTEQSKPATDSAAITPGNSSQPKIDYAKWMGIVATFLSIFLAFLTYGLNAERRTAEAKLEDSEQRQQELAANLEELRGRVDLDYNFYFEGAGTTGRKFMESNNLQRVFPNEVYGQVVNQMKRGKWDDLNNLMRCVYGVSPNDPQYGAVNSRQILYFEIFYNPSLDSKKPPAEKLEMAYRFKDFNPLPQQGSLRRQFSFNELNSNVNTWQTKTLAIGQLKAGSKVIIPIAHMVGPYTYSERLVIPTQIRWYNPLLKKNEAKPLDVNTIMSELDAKSQGSLLGNIGRSCQ